MQGTQAQDEQAQDDRLVELYRRLEDEADRLIDEIRRLGDEAVRAYQGNENVVLRCRREAKIKRLEARVLEIGVIADEALEATWSSSQPTGGTMSRRSTIRAGLERRRRNARSCYADAIRWRTLAARVARVAPRRLTPRTRAPRPRSRRTSSSSRTSSCDPGGDGEPEPPPPLGDSAPALLAQLVAVVA
jgi:hypothetical protein